MEKETRIKLAENIKDYHLPRYSQIPDVGLYLEQCVKLINSYLEPLGTGNITLSMISNYVKKGLVENPVKKQYFRQHLTKLIFIAVIKPVVALDDAGVLLGIQNESYSLDVAYDYFCEEFENVLYYTFGISSELKEVGYTDTEQKDLLQNAINTIVNKIYLDKYIALARTKQGAGENKR